ncbi:MAG: hypothetical protein GY835_07290 [bacterium]|nr:hypothetical protein [bacterium]
MKTGFQPFRAGAGVLICCLFMLCGLSAAVADDDPPQLPITVEAETFNASHNIGGYSIFIQNDSGACGGLFVMGLDFVDEWIDIPVTITTESDYKIQLRQKAEFGIAYRINVAMTPVGQSEGEVVAISFSGSGVG